MTISKLDNSKVFDEKRKSVENKKKAKIKKFDPDKYLTTEFIGAAIMECLLNNDPEGIVELLTIYLEEHNNDEKHIGKNPLQKPKSDSVFAPSAAIEEKQEIKPRGRPTQHEEKWTKVTCVLFNSQIAWLDHLAADIRMKTGAALSRAELIRAMIASIQAKDIDLTQITSEKDAIKKISSFLNCKIS